MNQIYGCINADGSIFSGSGDFIVVANDNNDGEYTIVFGKHFQNVPTVVATQNFPGWSDFTSDGGLTLDNVTIIAIAPDRVKFKTGASDGSGQNRNFCFIAIGV